MDTNALELALAALRTRITRVMPAQIRAAVETLDDDQLWWRPHEGSNSVANLVLHLSGSINHYLNRGVGGIPYDRNREQEFAERGRLPKQELLEIFNDMVAKAEQTFDTIDVARLSEPSAEQKMQSTVLEDLINVASHISTNTGQIVWIAKSMHPGSLDEIWMKTHKELGAWKGSK
jgi:uncharacterized damage-inducible protein DinB